MGLIVKGEHKIISKKEMANKVAQDIENNAKDGMEKMTDSQKEIRKEIASAKRHREFMQRVATKKAVSVREEREIAEKEVIETPEIIVEARAEKEQNKKYDQFVSIKYSAGKFDFQWLLKLDKGLVVHDPSFL